MQRDSRGGFAVVDLLASLVVAALLLGLGVPLVLAAREEARQASCTDNLRQVGAAVHGYADAHHGEVPTYSDGGGRNWIVRLLPHLGYQEVFEAYRWDLAWDDQGNQAAVAQRVPVVQCPQTPHPERLITLGDSGDVRGGPSDYIRLQITVAVRHLFPPGFDVTGALSGRTIYDIPDGLACTGMVFESADKPNQWRVGKLDKPREGSKSGAWAGSNANGYRGYTADGLSARAPAR